MPYQRIEISAESWPEYQRLSKDPFDAPFVFEALRRIQDDRYSYGRPHRPKPPLRTAVILLLPNRQLWLYWNPHMTPTTVVTLAVFSRPSP